MATEPRRIVVGDGAGVVVTDIKKARAMIREAQERAVTARSASRERALRHIREQRERQEQSD